MKIFRLRHILCYLVIILIVVVSGGCRLLPDIDISPPDTTEPPVTTGTPIDPDWTLPPVGNNSEFLPSIADVVTKVKPSTVIINTEVITFDIFNRPSTAEGAGSGWIIREDGIIVTNNHVVQDADTITVILADGRTYSVDPAMIATDPFTDLAVLKINTDESLPVAQLGDSTKLRVGEWVIAIGNSLNLGVTPSEGIVRSLGASVPISAGQSLFGLVGTSAAINPGNSGGPLVNLAGEVVGITTIKISMVGIEAMGWAISTETALPVIDQLIRNGYVTRPWLGIRFFTVDQFAVSQFNLAIEEGVFIAEVVPNSPANNAGLREEDIIVGFDELVITTADDLVQAIFNAEVGQQVTITYWRNEIKRTTTVVLGESPRS